jgi:hypothetical protein
MPFVSVFLVQKNLRWGCDFETADRICNFNRHYAGKLQLLAGVEEHLGLEQYFDLCGPNLTPLNTTEHSGYFEMKSDFVKYAKGIKGEIQFYDSNTGKLLYSAPRGRSMDDFLKESKAHGWPSFRDTEVSIELRYIATCVACMGLDFLLTLRVIHKGKLGQR